MDFFVFPVVTVDLKSTNARIQECLKRLQPITVILTWHPPTLAICPSSVGKYFHDLNYCVNLCKIESTSRTLNSTQIAKLDHSDPHEFIEWLGMITVGGDLVTGTPDGYVTTYEPPPMENIGPVTAVQWRGFFSANQIARALEELRPLTQTHQWVAVYVQGFSDSPISWANQQHHYYTNGDNGYVVVMEGENVKVFKQECSRKRYSSKVKSH